MTDNSVILNVTTDRFVDRYKIDHLTPFTVYEISVSAGNYYGFGLPAITSFLTSEEAPSGPPMNIKATSRSASSLLLVWDPPEKNKQNGVITSYTACLSHLKNGSCFQMFTTGESRWLIGNLNFSTKYYVRILARNKAGSSNYSEGQVIFSNEHSILDRSEEEINGGCKTYLLGMIISATLVIASFVAIACLVRKNRRLKSLYPTIGIVNMKIRRKNSSNIYDIPEQGNVCDEENLESPQENYTELQRRDHEGFYMKYNTTR
ncbi:receptor-type tyrosine-protein phosphatase F-like [Dendronephthya gigantea]|uniref:receptor-type tyrosine-protein phosphatase F-like n=1 Tax=Dendronephthya gigantea TaxID=151771 RepID=UPI00106AEF26|nr:receptor-type tyrosine-protein phosphatase F-like [Dendronephthya gigantea]